MKKLCEGWKEFELGELGDINAGGTPSRPKKEYWGGKIPWLKISNLKKFYVKEYDETITEEGLKDSSAKLFPKGTILISIFASLGNVAILKIESTTNQAIAGIYNLKKDVDKIYLAYYLKSLKKHFERIGRGVAQNNINLAILRKTKILLPPLPTQKAIVSILEKAEKAKEWRKEADDLTKEFLKSVFLEMFGDPIKNTKELFQEKGRDLFKFSSGKFNPISNLKDSFEFPTYGGNGITGYSKNYLINFQTLVIGRVGAYCGSIHKTPIKSWITDNAIYIKEFKKEFNLDFLYYLFDFLKINRFALTVGQPKITQKPLEELQYLHPPISLQNKFASIVKDVESIKQHQKKSREEIDNLFNALMQKAFKGELII